MDELHTVPQAGQQGRDVSSTDHSPVVIVLEDDPWIQMLGEKLQRRAFVVACGQLEVVVVVTDANPCSSCLLRALIEASREPLHRYGILPVSWLSERILQ